MFEAWAFPIVVGLTMLGVLYYISTASRSLHGALQQLYQINQEVEQDALKFIEQSWPVLSASGINGLHLEIEWFGEPLSLEYGNAEGHSDQHTINEIELKAALTFYRLVARGEKKLLTDLLIQTFVLILSSNLTSKQQQVRNTRERISRMQLFGQHDLKNLVQFLTLFHEQLELSDTDQKKLSLFDRIKAQMPVVINRAERVNPNRVGQTDNIRKVDLDDTLTQLAKAHGLTLTIKGSATYEGSVRHIREALNNVLENFRQHHDVATDIYANIEQSPQDISISIYTNKPDDLELLPASRMFEPFFTTSKSGMGLGLYLARLALSEINSTIKLLQEDDCYGFQINLSQKQQG